MVTLVELSFWRRRPGKTRWFFNNRRDMNRLEDDFSDGSDDDRSNGSKDDLSDGSKDDLCESSENDHWDGSEDDLWDGSDASCSGN
ncbi:6218_t:CDS:2 [Gigaspora rosea]|nr:6218_t:CDS:2 [Gigaspora rosea]